LRFRLQPRFFKAHSPESVVFGKTLSQYKILEGLGRGGMGIVYKAEDTKLDRTVSATVLRQNETAC